MPSLLALIATEPSTVGPWLRWRGTEKAIEVSRPPEGATVTLVCALGDSIVETPLQGGRNSFPSGKWDRFRISLVAADLKGLLTARISHHG